MIYGVHRRAIIDNTVICYMVIKRKRVAVIGAYSVFSRRPARINEMIIDDVNPTRSEYSRVYPKPSRFPFTGISMNIYNIVGFTNSEIVNPRVLYLLALVYLFLLKRRGRKNEFNERQ